MSITNIIYIHITIYYKQSFWILEINLIKVISYALRPMLCLGTDYNNLLLIFTLKIKHTKKINKISALPNLQCKKINSSSHDVELRTWIIWLTKHTFTCKEKLQEVLPSE